MGQFSPNISVFHSEDNEGKGKTPVLSKIAITIQEMANSCTENKINKQNVDSRILSQNPRYLEDRAYV